jgi:hypothetical protein
MTHRLFIPSITLLVLLAIPVQAQEPTTKPALDEKATALRKKAFKLLDSVAEQVGSLQSPENRARIASNVADLLWEQDEKRSRDLMQSVAQDLRTLFSEIDPHELDGLRDWGVLVKLRSDIIGRLAKRDVEAALEFLRSTRPPERAEPTQKKRRVFDELARQEPVERELELQLVERAAAKNPKFALQLGREIMTKQLSYDLMPLLSELVRRDASAANAFYKMLVDQLRETPVKADSLEWEFAFQLARAFRPPTVDEQPYRTLLGVVLVAAINGGCGAPEGASLGYCYQMGPLFPVLEKYYGARAAPLKGWAMSAEEVARAEGWERAREVQERGTVDDILDLAAKYPEMRSNLTWKAFQKVVTAGDLATARQIAENNPDADARRSMLAQVEERQQWESANAQKLAALQQTLNELPGDEVRVGYIFEVVRQLGENDRKMAIGLLDQASLITARSKSPRLQIMGQAALALYYSLLNSDRGFPILEALMPKLNELIAASVQLDGLEINYVRDGEWNMSSEGILGSLLVNLAQNAEYFARVDFDRSVALTNQLQRAELRLMAQEKIAQGILAPSNTLSIKVTPPIDMEFLRAP